MNDADKRRQAVPSIRNSIVAVARRLKQSAKLQGESWTNLMVLGAIERDDGQATPTQIAFDLDLRSSNLAQILGELDERGLIEKKSDPADKRKTRLSLTETGRVLLFKTRSQRDDWLFEAMNECLSEQERDLLIAAGEIMHRLSLARHGKG
ncbi:MarR family winged helix-turn-helix transcriptional regulator [Pigmentiphaga humi]|uniref:MarR family winged helix-turn-helix transcriptional regulator n=1 Tax=Pigmentiphaga humi TaxID=2478468 RepID=UPI000F53462D|nr:winged helix DNA-binding protein [Pigmentiphaga humi]